ncbi:MAG TPA: type III secretion system chaperone [Geminicoccaceae bacterium]|nr:type III secretion system chaperone [Geminicoccus sp.]HMU52198.1 type III secretion system chaperone [Geminicoccaceae bacterium]
MATDDELRATIAGFGGLVGLEGLALDDEGECALEAGDLTVHLKHFDDAGVLVAYADLGPVPERLEPEIFRLLLGGNLSWRDTAGGSLAVHPELRRAGLVVRLDLLDLTAPELQERFRDIVECGQQWLERLDELRGVSAAHPEDLDPRMMSPIRG